MSGVLIAAGCAALAPVAWLAWLEWRWRRSPLGRAHAELVRRRRARQQPLARALTRRAWAALRWTSLAVLWFAFVAWAITPFVAELLGAWRSAP